jgi:hypothetical protein
MWQSYITFAHTTELGEDDISRPPGTYAVVSGQKGRQVIQPTGDVVPMLSRNGIVQGSTHKPGQRGSLLVSTGCQKMTPILRRGLVYSKSTSNGSLGFQSVPRSGRRMSTIQYLGSQKIHPTQHQEDCQGQHLSSCLCGAVAAPPRQHGEPARHQHLWCMNK